MISFKNFLVFTITLFSSTLGYAQCDFTISPVNKDSNCQYAVEEVVWINDVNLTIVGNDLRKNGGGASFNAGAFSTSSINNFGYVETVVNETNRDRVFGLSSVDGGVDRASINYGVQLRQNGQLRIYENGSEIANPGAYSSGDVIRISVENNVIKYFRNNILLRISNAAPTLPLFVDTSFEDVNGTLEEVVIANGTDGEFIANETNPGTGEVYEWFLNGVSQTTGATYSNTTLNAGDVISAVLTPGTGGCDVVPVNSNEITIIDQDPFFYSEFYIVGNASQSACKEAIESAVFTGIRNLEVVGNDIRKLQGGASFNAGAISLNTVSDNGYARTTAAETNRDRVFGLSSADGGVDRASIDYGVQLRQNGLLRIYESGVEVANTGGYVTGDIIRIAVEDGVVHYYRNNDLLRISNTAPTLPLFVDVSFEDVGGTLNDIEVVNGNTGEFSAMTTNAGASPTYQWRLNGAPVGLNQSTYTNAALNNGDVVTVDITPNLDRCSNVTITTLPVTINNISEPDFGDFYVANTASASACKEAIESAVFTGIRNLEVVGNDIQKLQGGASFNAGAISLNTVSDNGYARTTAAETNRDRVFGLSSADGGVDRASIDYGIQLRQNGELRIYENGAEVANPGGYNTGDIILIAVENGVVHYYRNNDLLRISNTAPTLPLFVDVSFEDVGGTLNDIEVVNGNTGEFSAVTTNAGTSPAYQWRLNGAPVGSNQATYTNTALNDGDVVTVDITPDLGGCNSVTYTANTVTINNIPEPDFGDFYVANTASASACKEAIESAVFTGIRNLEVVGNDIQKLQGGASFNAGAISLNRVSDNGYTRTTVAETNRDRVFGLSSADGGANRASIDYGIQLRQNGQLRIYESGVEVANPGGYVTGDIIRIAVENGVVHYYRNNDILRISNTAPTLPLFVDVTFEDVGGTLNDIEVVNGNTGEFSAVTTNAGTSPTYQWRLNGAPVGANQATYTNTALNNGDVVTVDITPDLGGCNSVTYTANTVTINDITNQSFGEFFITNTPSVDLSQPVAFADITWTDLVNVDATGNSITKIQGGGSFNAGAASLNTINNNSLIQTIVTQTNRDRVIGLSNSNGGNDRNSIDFAVQLRQNGQLRIYESGTQRVGNAGGYAINDTIKVAISAGNIEYYRNSDLLYTSTLTPVLPLIGDFSIEDVGGELSQVSIVDLTDGDFVATVVDAGSNPSYQWLLNGADVGTNSPNYSNAMLADGDVITLEIIPDLGGCSTITNPYVSNTITISTLESVLPVTLTFFDVRLADNGVILDWQTSTEINNDYYIIERAGKDLNFVEVARVSGVGNSERITDYNYTDRNAPYGQLLYRLTQVDFDGTTEQLEIESIFNSNKLIEDFKLYPNPVTKGTVKVEGDLSPYTSLSLTDINGSLILSIESLSNTEISFDVSYLKSGIYFLKLEGFQKSSVRKLIIQN